MKQQVDQFERARQYKKEVLEVYNAGKRIPGKINDVNEHDDLIANRKRLL